MIIEQQKADIIAFARAAEYFKNVPFITSDDGKLDAAVQEQLEGRGLTIAVEIQKGKVQFAEVGSGAMDFVVVFTIEEVPLLNRDSANEHATRKKATDVVEELFALFNPTQQSSIPCRAESFEEIQNTDDKVIYQVTATSNGGWKRKTAA